MEYTRLANVLTTSTFAVAKDDKKDRLISWPKVYNGLFPPPPFIDLPNPGLFQKIIPQTQQKHTDFFFDVANMFHNIVLPSNMQLIFPFKAVPFGNLSATLQLKITAEAGWRPAQHERARPLQRTLPMGFKWAVYIGHTFAKSCFTAAINIFVYVHSKDNPADGPSRPT